MRIVISHNNKVGRHRVYYATAHTPGRPQKNDEIKNSKKLFVTGTSKADVIQKYKDAIGFVPSA